MKERALPDKKLYRRDPLNEKEYEENVINNINWDEICMLQYRNASASLKSFYDTHVFHLDEMAPYHEVTLKEFRLMTKPWITQDILSKCNARDELLKKMKSESDPVRLQILDKEYKILRNQVTSEKRASKSKFKTSQFEENKNKSSNAWKCIRSLVNIKSNKASNIKLMDKEDHIPKRTLAK